MQEITRKPDDYYGADFADGYWTRRSRELYAQAQAAPNNRQLRLDLAHVESCREQAFERARRKWEREQEREYADRWLGEMAGAPGFTDYDPRFPGVLQ